MNKSLQDQLLALGLAKKNQQKKAGKTQRQPTRSGRTAATKITKNNAEVSLDKAYALRKREEQKQADTARRKKQAEDRQRRLINTEIRKIIKQHRLNSEQAEIARNFMFRGRIRKVYVTADQHKALGDGSMGIIYLSGGYHLLAGEQLEAVKKISAEHVVDLGGAEPEEEDHPVPDDLVW